MFRQAPIACQARAVAALGPCGFVAALIPALRASALSPVQALRAE